MNRRAFLERSSLAGLAIGFPVVIPSGVLARAGQPGANDRIEVGFIGIGNRAKAILREEGLPGGRLVAVADCHYPRCLEAASLFPDGDRWHTYPSYREMLDREKLDAVFVETTTHARVLAAIHALQAGCDVYAEKPLTLTEAEGRVLVDWVRKTGRILQTGTQQRSIPINVFASRLVREGAIGPIHTVITYNFLPAEDWMPRASRPIPEGLDWDQWCNQTELRPYHPSIQYGWSRYIDYDGGGQSWGVSGWGTHSLDQVQAALGTDDTGPIEIVPEEPGPFGRVTMRYAQGTVLRLEGPKRGLEDLGAIFLGEKGRIEIRRGSCLADPPELLAGAPPETPLGPGETHDHLINFFDCVRTRKRPNADVEIGHRSTTVCHLVNIVRAVSRRLTWDPAAETFVSDDEANEFLSRPRRAGFELPTA